MFKPNPIRTDRNVTYIIKIAGYSSILFLALIFFFLLQNGIPALKETGLAKLFQSTWYPTEAYFGILPLLFGSLLVTFLAIFIALPFGVGTAVFISEIAPRAMKEILKPLVEILAGMPSVVLGFIGIVVVVPYMQRTLNLPTGQAAITGAILLGLIAIPTVVSIAEDALNAVPQSYRQAALAMGATRWQTIWGITVPAAKTGILTAIMLGIGRTLGETMAVMMVTGNAAVMPEGLQSIFMPVRTMTATIASEMGEVAKGSAHYAVLFFIGIVLFIFSLIINILASWVSTRGRKRSERILS
jgi:phosphate transport system permease protein